MHYRLPPINQGNAIRGATPDLSSGMPPRNYAYPAIQYPLTYPGGILSNRPLGSSSAPLSPSNANGQTAASSSINASSGGQNEGGWKLNSITCVHMHPMHL